MRNGGGKQKGSAFEREVCVKLSRWITDDVQDDVFWRSAMSGGRATVQKQRGGRLLKNQVGDISAIDPVGHAFLDQFAIECKHYASLDFQGLLTGKGKLLQFWATISNEARDHRKLPVLIAKQNRIDPIICLSSDGLRVLKLVQGETLLNAPRLGLHILDFDYFLSVCSPVR